MALENLYETARQAREQQNRELRADGYVGKKRYQVLFDQNRITTVFAGDTIAAVWTALKHWGLDPRIADNHQRCRTRKL